MSRERYHAEAQRQRLTFEGHLIGCTDTSFAMLADAATLGGVIVDEATVRRLSGETNPDPRSPGLNLGQLGTVANKLRIAFDIRTGDTWADLLDELRNNARVVAQLDYAVLGGGDIGHAVYVEQVRKGRARIVDPIVGEYAWISADRLHRAMRSFAKRAQLADGLYWGASRRTPWVSDEQGPQVEE